MCLISKCILVELMLIWLSKCRYCQFQWKYFEYMTATYSSGVCWTQFCKNFLSYVYLTPACYYHSSTDIPLTWYCCVLSDEAMASVSHKPWKLQSLLCFDYMFLQKNMFYDLQVAGLIVGCFPFTTWYKTWTLTWQWMNTLHVVQNWQNYWTSFHNKLTVYLTYLFIAI